MKSAGTSTNGVEPAPDQTWTQRLAESRATSVRLRKRALLARLDAAIVMVAVEDARLHHDIGRYLLAAERGPATRRLDRR